jgi:hypothetical protein
MGTEDAPELHWTRIGIAATHGRRRSQVGVMPISSGLKSAGTAIQR